MRFQAKKPFLLSSPVIAFEAVKPRPPLLLDDVEPKKSATEAQEPVSVPVLPQYRRLQLEHTLAVLEQAKRGSRPIGLGHWIRYEEQERCAKRGSHRFTVAEDHREAGGTEDKQQGPWQSQGGRHEKVGTEGRRSELDRTRRSREHFNDGRQQRRAIRGKSPLVRPLLLQRCRREAEQR
jgi:hypothetical protein